LTKRYYTEKIKNELEKYGRLHFNKLQRQTGIPTATLTSKLKDLKNKKQIDNEAASRNGKVVSEYFLTEDEKIRRLWKIDSEQIQDKKDKMKAFLLITHFAAFGYEYLDSKDPSKAKLGDVMISISNKDRIQEYSLGGDKKPGVSINDLVKLPAINSAAIFTDVDYSEQELNGYFRLLIKRNPPIITALDKRNDGFGMRYRIANKDLEVFIKKCWVMFYTVSSRMEYTWAYIRRPKPDSKEAQWYATFFGTKKTEELIKRIEKKRQQLGKKNEKEKQDLINDVYNGISNNDVNIIAMYKQLLSGKHEHVRKKYRLITNRLLEACYPYFIRTLHKENQKQKT
jgi:DNA-binding HxlR family transcriptional regulator